MAKEIILEQLSSVVDALATGIRNKGYEQKVNLKALAYKDSVEFTDLNVGLQNEINEKATIQDVTSQINTQIASVYKPGGSKTESFFSAEPVESQLGYVYNTYNEFTTNNYFIEGPGNIYPAGSDVAVVAIQDGTNILYRYNVLAGFIDQTQFASATEFAASKIKLDNFSFATDQEIQDIIDSIIL